MLIDVQYVNWKSQAHLHKQTNYYRLNICLSFCKSKHQQYVTLHRFISLIVLDASSLRCHSQNVPAKRKRSSCTIRQKNHATKIFHFVCIFSYKLVLFELHTVKIQVPQFYFHICNLKLSCNVANHDQCCIFGYMRKGRTKKSNFRGNQVEKSKLEVGSQVVGCMAGQHRGNFKKSYFTKKVGYHERPDIFSYVCITFLQSTCCFFYCTFTK